MKNKTLILFLTLLFSLTGMCWHFGNAESQSAVQLDSVTVNLWPESDRSSVLVTYEIKLSDTTSLPHELVFQIPADAQVQAVVSLDADDRPVSLEKEVIPNGLWQDIQFTTLSSTIRLEYYDPAIVKQDDLRLFEYQWLSIYRTESLSVFIEQPFGANEIMTDPPLSRINDDSRDRTYYTTEIGPVDVGELFSLTLQYVKNSANLAYPALEVSLAVPIDENTRGRTASPLSVVMWLLAVAVAVLILVGLYYWWFRVNIHNKRDHVVQGVGILNPEKQAVFCHECGMRSRTGDSYCRNCGTELRRFS